MTLLIGTEKARTFKASAIVKDYGLSVAAARELKWGEYRCPNAELATTLIKAGLAVKVKETPEPAKVEE